MVVVACNSASAAGLPEYRAKTGLPLIGVIEPGVRAALSYTRNNRIGVIGTAVTINSSAYQKALKNNNPQVQVIGKACPLFVLLVENNLVNTPEAKKVAEEYLEPFKEAEIDTLILGCTHYPLMSDLIQEVVGQSVKLVSSAEETAAEVKQILTARNLLTPLNSDRPRHRFFVSGKPAAFEEIGAKMLQRPIKAYQVVF